MIQHRTPGAGHPSVGIGGRDCQAPGGFFLERNGLLLGDALVVVVVIVVVVIARGLSRGV